MEQLAEQMLQQVEEVVQVVQELMLLIHKQGQEE
jgi:hypothetical protein